jgi:HSP20 family protein
MIATIATIGGSMATKDPGNASPTGKGALEGLMAGFLRLLERVEQISEEGGERVFRGTFPARSSSGGGGGEPRALKGVYGVSLKVGGLGGDEVKIEPFGNLRRDETTGEPVLEEVREPLVDVFDEPQGVLIVAEMPGVEAEDVRVAVEGARLTLEAERGERRYKKQLDVPAGLRADQVDVHGQNGIIELRARRG